MNKTSFESAQVFKAFCDETRLTVLSLLQNGEQCACVLLERVRVSQPTLSHHMKILVESGIVTARKEGKWMYYAISAAGCENAAKLLRQLTTVRTGHFDGNNDGRCGDACCKEKNTSF